MMGKQFLLVKEFAEMLGAKPSTVLKWIRNGDLPAVRLGRRWVIPVEMVYQKALSPKPPVSRPTTPEQPNTSALGTAVEKEAKE
jgi:excisionase family DNA binding protein